MKYTQTQLLKLTRKADSGDKASLKKLRDYNRELVRVANSRLNRLEKAGLDFYAYDRAVNYTQQEYGRNRFSYSVQKLPEPADVYTNIIEAQTFLKSPSSTVTGQRNIMKQRADAFREKGLSIPEGKEVQFNDFLASSVFDGLKDAFGSDQLIDILADYLQAPDTNIDTLQEEFDTVLSGETTIDVVLEEHGVVF